MEERETRRRRILSKETDRLALITGRIHNLDVSPSPRSFLQDSHHGLDDEKVLEGNASGSQVPDLRKDEEESSAPAIHNELQPSTPRIPKNPNGSVLSEKPLSLLLKLTPKEINSSIISSENTRVICSVVIAVLVVLSHINLPHNVVTSKSLIAYRPLYVVLLTDVLVVAGKLALYTQIKEEDEEPKFDKDGDTWAGAVKLLELGLVLHQSLRAIFIDCSFYLVIVICGLSLV